MMVIRYEVFLICLSDKSVGHYFFFFFKQKTAYEMRISDWSSDVCSSDLRETEPEEAKGARLGNSDRGRAGLRVIDEVPIAVHTRRILHAQIGRASCRERVCQYV